MLTASAVVLDDQNRILLIHHNKIGLYLYPGGDLNAQLDEVSHAHWVTLTDLADPPTPTEFPALVNAAATWASTN